MSDDRIEDEKEVGRPEEGRGVTRRKFIQSVGLGAAAVGLASAAVAAEGGGGKPKAMKKTRDGKKLKLTVAFSENPRVAPLREGIVRSERIDFEFETISPNNLFFRNLSEGMKSDVSEMSISETFLARERRDTLGKGRWNWTPIPLFLSRGLFWADLFVNNGSGISGLGDLKGKRIGVPDYCMTAALWFKITLKDLYGIDAGGDVWYNNRTRQRSHGGMLGLDIQEYGPGKGVTLHFLPVDQTIDILLDRGELDAAFPPETAQGVTVGNTSVLDRYGGTPMTDNPRIHKLLLAERRPFLTIFARPAATSRTTTL